MKTEDIESISFNVCVSLLKKDRFVKGEKGLYANLVLWPCEPDSESADYGDFMVKQKGERGDKMPILGNAKIWRRRNGDDNGTKRRSSRRREDDRHRDDRDEIPF